MSKRRPALSNANPAVAVLNWVGRRAGPDDRLVGALMLATAALTLAEKSAQRSDLLGSRAGDIEALVEDVSLLCAVAASEQGARNIEWVRRAAQDGDEQALAIVRMLDASDRRIESQWRRA
jgi:hypothetical protein